MEEQNLIELLKRGDLGAFKDLVDVYQHKVFATCYRFLLNQEDAEDVSQEVFIEIFNSVHLFRRESKLSTWIYRIAVTKSLDTIRKKKRRKRFSSIGQYFGLDEVAHLVLEKSRPDKDFEEQENWASLMEVLDVLPDNQRVAFTLSKIEDYSNAEIADVLQTTVSAVDSLIYRAKQRLKVELAHWDK
jgi:RNA polymerase sigma-70 factor, ECF subfamily